MSASFAPFSSLMSAVKMTRGWNEWSREPEVKKEPLQSKSMSELMVDEPHSDYSNTFDVKQSDFEWVNI